MTRDALPPQARPSGERLDARTLIALAGAGATALIAGFTAPLIEIGGRTPLATPSARLFAVALVLALACAIVLAQRALTARRERAFVRALDHRGSPDERSHEADLLARRFEQAAAQMRTLGRASSRGSATLFGRSFMHDLPWYLIIGAPGAGKTTVLLNSGLRFPLARGRAGEAVRGIGGTRHCDWWFAAEAVLIDTAGRYTTQDSDRRADAAAWQAFLDLLKRHRPRRPLNGVLLALSATDLLQASPQRLATQARELRERLAELRERLDFAVPAYVLVTKCDLLPGFDAFFADLNDGARAQVWGATLRTDARTDAWAEQLAALDGRLHARLLARLAAEPDEKRRNAIHAFPRHWRALAQASRNLLDALGTPERGSVPMLRGLYFTSATQPSSAGRDARSYFVTRLLRDVVFAESGLAGRTPQTLERQRWCERGALAAAAAAFVAGGAFAWHAQQQQAQAIEALSAQMPALADAVTAAQRSDDLPALLPVLDALAAVKSTLPATRDDAALSHLLDRRELLTAAAADAYRRLLHDAFLPRIAARLEARLRAAEGQPAERTYETLRAYLMLFGGKHFDAAALRAFIADDWTATLPDNIAPVERAALRRHLDQLLAGGEVGAPARADAQLIATVRARVRRVPLTQRAATRLRQIEATLPQRALSADGALVHASGAALALALPPHRTRTDMPQRARIGALLAQLAHEQTWVLDTSAPPSPLPARLIDEVERLYALDGAVHWQTLLDDVRLAPSADLAASARLAQALARADAPLYALLRATVEDTADGPAHSWFAPQRAWLADGAADVQALLQRLAAQLDAAHIAVQRGALPPAGDALRELERAALRAPQPANRLLTHLHAAALAQWQAGVREPAARDLARELAPACARWIAHRYPFAHDAAQELTRNEFARAFGAGGVFDGIAQRHLTAWGDDARLEAATPLRRAREVRDAFFRDGGRSLGTRLEFRLLELGAGAHEFTLDVDGQTMRFRRDTTRPQAIDWLTLGSSQGGEGGRVQVQLTPSSSGQSYTFKGPWALLRLLERARVDAGASPDRVLVTFDIEGRKARFEVRSQSARNPLLRNTLESPPCPGRS
jgi:type VI secretion system protein ImpL